MSRASQVIILCEDRLYEVFVRRFLREYGYTNRDVRTVQYPATGRGSAESFVRRAYPDELRAYRSRSRGRQAKTFLIVMVDADAGSVADRETDLRLACEEASVEWRKQGELVVHVIPRRAVNTWLAYLDGVHVDETERYETKGYGFRKCEADVSPLVKSLHALCAASQLPPEAPPSLTHACVEFARIKDHLR